MVCRTCGSMLGRSLMKLTYESYRVADIPRRSKGDLILAAHPPVLISQAGSKAAWSASVAEGLCFLLDNAIRRRILFPRRARATDGRLWLEAAYLSVG